MRISDWSSDVCSSDLSLHMAFVEARSARHEFITVEHLLLSLLDNAAAVEVLRACSANLDVLRQELRNFVNKNTPIFPGEDEVRSEEHTSELQSLMRISYAVFCLQQTHETDHNN